MHLITTTAELSDAVAALSKSEFVTVDTEFIRETTFWPELALIQMAAPGVEALVDPLAPGIDLAPFFELMANEAVLKVFHAARQDIEIVFHRGNLIPHPVFDTQVAAMVCGYGDSIAYDALVSRITGGHIDKTSRFTDWKARPLSDRQLEYAMADVTHLRDVYLSLKQKLQETGRAHWLNEEMATLTARETYDLKPQDAWTRLKLRARKPVEFQILKNLAEWRENEARARNVPRSRVLKDDAIYEIAQQAPRDAAALGKLRTIPNGWEKSRAATPIMEAVQAALAMAKEDLPKLPRPPQAPEGGTAAVELLKVLLKLTAEKYGVAAKIIATSDDLEAIAAQGADADTPVLHGWRNEMFGAEALKLVRGQTVLKFEGKRIVAAPA